MTKLTPTMVQALNHIGTTGTIEGLRKATVQALVSRELVWDRNGKWYFTSDAHNGDDASQEAREADLARQDQLTAQLVEENDKTLKSSRKATPQTPVGLGGEFDDDYNPMTEQDEQRKPREQAAKDIQPYRRTGPASRRIISCEAIGPQITVVVKVGRKLVMGVVVGTVTRPMASYNRHLVTVKHFGDDGQLLPRVTLHAANEVAA